MKHFMDYLEETQKSEKTLTENLAVAYETSGDELLDFNFKLTSLRSSSEEEIIKSFKKVYYRNDPVIAIKYLFYVGDIREGMGERNIFRTCIKWLCEVKPELARKVIHLIPEYSRWDILTDLVDVKQIKARVIRVVKEQLSEDINNMNNGNPVSLLAKWMPSENTSSKHKRNLARIYIKEFKISPKRYRHILSSLRSYIDVVEVKMSSKNWSEINYSAVPSQANLKYSNAFLKNDYERRCDYLSSLARGETKINASVSQPHEIVNKYAFNSYWYKEAKDYDETLEQMWKALPNKVTKNTLVVRDGSGSMTAPIAGRIEAIDVATALAIYCSEHTTEAFKDKFITFSSKPKFIDLSYCHSLKDKLDLTYAENDMSNTNMYATMKLILDTAVCNKLSQKDMPDNILIISDMQFDGRWMKFDESLFDQISREYNFCGYKLPRICFWNLCGYDAKTIPLQKNELGLILCSGFSINNLNMFMSGEIDPLKVLMDIINSDRYKAIENAFN